MYKKSDIRNAIFSNSKQTIIDFELNHKTFGWIPYSLDINNVATEDEHLLKDLVYKTEIKEYIELTKTNYNIQKEIDKLVVTTSKGHTFDANSEARQNMTDAIIASETLKQTQTYWNLADYSRVLIDIDELREAHALAILEYAKVKQIL